MPPRTVGVALIGAGFMGEFHARGYESVARVLSYEAEPVIRVVADADVAKGRTLADHRAVGEVTQDWRAAIDRSDVELVDICTPPAFHAEIAAFAAGLGKHVYCEKPVGRTLAETSVIKKATDDAGVKTFVGYNYRWYPAVVFAHQLIDQGRLGDIYHVRIAFDSDWASNPQVPWAWRLSAEEAGHGALGDVGSHVFDMARYLAGEISEIVGQTRTVVHERPSTDGGRKPVDTDDSFEAIGMFSNGAGGAFHGSRVATGSKIGFLVSVVGSKGAIVWDERRANELQLYLGDDASDPTVGFQRIEMGPNHPFHGWFSPVQGLGIGFQDTKTIEVAQIIKSVATGEPFRPDFADALAVARIVNAAASHSRQTIT